MKINRFTKLISGIILIASNVSCDQLTKNQVRRHIDPLERIQVVRDNFILTKVENTGAALSFGENFPPLLKLFIFQIIPVFVMIGLFVYFIRQKSEIDLNFLAITFIVGGGTGNIIDRILFNSVTDFMYIEIGALHTGIFNMADVSVTIGVIILLLNSLMGSQIKKFRLNF